jgi:diguanylate cyclase (GGDEF)-like protein/putative nucleotidyltransferase with HDIG domain
VRTNAAWTERRSLRAVAALTAAIVVGLTAVQVVRWQIRAHSPDPRIARAARLDSLAARIQVERSDIRDARARKALGQIAAALRSTAVDEQTAAAGVSNPFGTAQIVATIITLLAGAVLLIRLGLRRNWFDTKHKLVERLEEQANTDALTGLGNRRAFNGDLAEAIAARASTNQIFSLIAIDLDNLKGINDRKGHPAGDIHIRAVAEGIRQAIGVEGVVYRTGGDEFMVLLPGRRNWHGLSLCHRIDQLTRVATGGRAVSMGLTESIGTESKQLLIRQADIALYEAKRTKLSSVVYHPGLGVPRDVVTGDLPTHDQRALASALARAVDAKDSATNSHSETVAQLCVAIAQRLGLADDLVERLRLAGLLHDVGKIGVEDAILQKPGPLDENEEGAMREHVEIGHAILLAAELPREADWVLHHHERLDGTGYPSGQVGDAIPLQSRIIAVADAYEAITGDRPYHPATTAEEALATIEGEVGTQFDADCVDALIHVVQAAVEEQAAPERRTA